MFFRHICTFCALITSSGIYAQFTVKGTVLFEGADKAAGATLHLLQSRTVATDYARISDARLPVAVRCDGAVQRARHVTDSRCEKPIVGENLRCLYARRCANHEVV